MKKLKKRNERKKLRKQGRKKTKTSLDLFAFIAKNFIATLFKCKPFK